MEIYLINEILTNTINNNLDKNNNNNSFSSNNESNNSRKSILDYSREKKKEKEVNMHSNLSQFGFDKSIDKQEFLSKVSHSLLNKSLEKLNTTEYQIKNLPLTNISWEKLNEIKVNIKEELKKYDKTFFHYFNTEPNKKEKEPIRNLYLYYKKVKIALEKAENENNKNSGLQNDILNLKKEKNDLKIFLADYEKKFIEQNNRKIKYTKDILPIQNQYKRFKDIKNLISKYE